MIACEECDDWFHGKCISISRKSAKYIEKYYCDSCIKRNSELKIVYKPDRPEKFDIPKKVVLPKTPKIENSKKLIQPDTENQNKIIEKKSTSIQPLLRQTQEQQTSTKKAVLKKTAPSFNKSGQPRRKPGPKGKSKIHHHHRKQCGNPVCCFEARPESSYCSEECGLEFNKQRYEKFFMTKTDYIKSSHGKTLRMKHWGMLNSEKESIIKKINMLKDDKLESENTINRIKAEAKAKCKPKWTKIKDHEDTRDDSDPDDNEEVLSSDATKTYCITCGATITANQALKHWSTCHKKNEDVYNFTADQEIKFEYNETEDPHPRLRCNHKDKKSGRFCMNIEGACPLHSNWNCDKDEVCGCPLNVTQKLIPDGNYCTELKKDCIQHYHWDRFRIAQINMERLHAFTKLDIVNAKLKDAEIALDDCFGGVVGLMLHNTLDEKIEVD